MTDDDEDADWSGEDWSDDADNDTADDDDQIACPECGTAMPGFLEKCPKCGYWLTEADQTQQMGAKRPAWQRVVAAVLIIGFLLLLLLAGSRFF